VENILTLAFSDQSTIFLLIHGAVPDRSAWYSKP